MKLGEVRHKLSDLSYELAVIVADESFGESYHENYKKNKVAFAALIKQEQALRKAVRGWQLRMVKQLPKLVDWDAFKGGNRKSLLKPEGEWSPYRVELEELLFEQIWKAFGVGIMYGEGQLKTQISFSGLTENPEEKLRARARESAASVMQTFQNRVVAKLIKDIEKRTVTAAEFPIDLDEDVEEDLRYVTNDTSKADGISATEIIAAVAFGLLFFGKAAGADTKTWRTQEDGKVDDVCQSLDGETVPIDQTFESIDGDMDAPPDPHVNCRCYLDVNGESTGSGEQGGQEPYTYSAPKAPSGTPLNMDSLAGTNETSEMARAVAGKLGQRDNIAFGEQWLKSNASKLMVTPVDVHSVKYIPGVSQARVDYMIGPYADRLKLTEPAPIIIDGTTIIDGATRVAAFIKAGRKTIQAINIAGIL